MNFLRRFSLQLTPARQILLAAWFFITFTNFSFWQAAFNAIGTDNWHSVLFLAALYLLLITWLNQILSLLLLPWLFKPLLSVLLLGGATTAYFMDSYGVVIDREMVRNTLMTDPREAGELLSLKLGLYLVLLGVLPVVLLLRSKIQYASFMKEVGYKFLTLVMTLVISGGVAAAYYVDIASFARNNTYIRHMIVPVNYVSAIESYIRSNLEGGKIVVSPLGEDAKKGTKITAGGQKKVLTVIVVGEAARASEFSLNGYARDTNPELSKLDIVNYRNVSSCGTETAVSVPCMFSKFTRQDYSDSKAKRSENLVDVLKHAGFELLWKDNNSSSRGVAVRIGEQNVQDLKVPGLCNNGECFDEILLYQLQDYIDKLTNDGVIVLHMKGSHGPAYYLRSPEKFKKFLPECRTNQLQDCPRQELINAYDNTIVYSDYVLSQVIKLLQQNNPRFDTAMLYMADHGESTGEKGIYLHAAPYMIAPEEQTHIGALQWFSPSFLQRMKLDKNCLLRKADEPLSQDNLFHSVLGLLDVKTSAYDTSLDMFASCTAK
nr:phosphoethanolamine--lipid A transferase [uncultured Tolumonas sp.]